MKKQGGDCHPPAPTPENDGASERRGLARRLPAPRSQKRPGDQTGAVTPGRGRKTRPKTRVRTPRKGQEQSQTELNHGENWKTQPSREPPNVSSRKGATGSNSKPTDQRRKKSPLPSRDSAEATDLNRNGVNEHIRPGERNDHQALTHQTTLPPGRETNGKPAPGPRAILRYLPQA